MKIPETFGQKIISVLRQPLLLSTFSAPAFSTYKKKEKKKELKDRKLRFANLAITFNAINKTLKKKLKFPLGIFG